MSDLDQFENTAAWLEYCDGMSRFEAETEAARRQGAKRHEVMNEIRQRDFAGRRNIGSPDQRHPENDMPGVQPAPEKENGPLSQCQLRAGSHLVVLLALLAFGSGLV